MAKHSVAQKLVTSNPTLITEEFMTSIILDLTTSEIVATFNNISKTPVTKFRDRKTAEQRLSSITCANPGMLLTAMKAAEVRPEMIAKFENEITSKAAAAEKAAEKAASAPKPPKEEKAPKAPKAQKEPKAPKAPKAPRLTKLALRILVTALPMVEADAEQTTNSHDLAKALNLSPSAVIKCLDELAQLGLITAEDDSSPTEPFYFIKMTDKGTEMAKSKPEAAAKSEHKGGHGPVSQFAGKVIVPIVSGNPRKEGSIGHHSFSLLRPGMTYEEYIEAGGRGTDLRWDLAHNFVELR